MFKSISKTKTQPSHKHNAQQRKEGEVRVETTVQQKSHFSENDGEYIDYEEIK